MSEKKKEIIFEIEDAVATYRCDLLNKDILDNLNLKQEDLKETKFTYKYMPDFFYGERIIPFGNVTVGGSLEVSLYTYNKGIFKLQPFLRYDPKHKSGVKFQHLHIKLRVIDNKGKEFYLPDEWSGYNIFGNEMPKHLKLAYPINWKCYDPDNPNKKYQGIKKNKVKHKPQKS